MREKAGTELAALLVLGWQCADVIVISRQEGKGRL